MPNRDAQLFVCPEAVANVEEVPAATEAVHFDTFSLDIAGSGPTPRDAVLPVADRLPPGEPMDYYAQGELSTEIKLGAAAATDVPELGPVFVAGGMKQTVGVGDVTYVPDDSPALSTRAGATATLRLEEEPAGDGNVYVAIGSRFGGLSIEGAFNKPPRFKSPYMGRFKTPADLAALTGGTWNAGAPVGRIKTGGTYVTVHGYNPVLRSYSINANIELSLRGSTKDGGTGGYAWPCWIGRKANVAGSLDFESTDQTEFAFWAKVLAGTQGTVAFTYATGSRTLVMTLNQTVFGYPKRTSAPGEPTIYRVPLLAGYGASATLSLVFS